MKKQIQEFCRRKGTNIEKSEDLEIQWYSLCLDSVKTRWSACKKRKKNSKRERVSLMKSWGEMESC